MDDMARFYIGSRSKQDGIQDRTVRRSVSIQVLYRRDWLCSHILAGMEVHSRMPVHIENARLVVCEDPARGGPATVGVRVQRMALSLRTGPSALGRCLL
jgi:hypothetical protein